MSDDGEEARDPLISHNTFYGTKHLTSQPRVLATGTFFPLDVRTSLLCIISPRSSLIPKADPGQLCLKCE